MKIFKLTFIALFACLFMACNQGSGEKTSADWKAQHVVLIGLDGWTASSLKQADMPNVKEMMQNGSYTLKKRSALPSSSAINWASMFMGAGPELHGYTTWGSTSPELDPREITHYGMFPSVWGLLRDQYPDSKIGYFYEWGGLRYLAEMKAMSVEMQSSVPEDSEITKTEQTIINGCNYIKEAKPNFIGILVDEPDHIGHSKGFDSIPYIDLLPLLDKYVGQIVDAVKEAGIYDETIFIVTSDHGGIHKNHGGKTMNEMETPFIVCGKGVKKNYEFTESMMQYDVASTIAYMFNIEQPQVWIGRPMSQIFE
ncbi:putative AlkP superfamily pyrophosphatase or phosphodiesterase [Dysgonomonadaceae bacterium PH5-43]|nr:putative AlkP superfamily pyrophosphatase or phosphodiesterase [Dysgonomonadaceae bacterium PH5-43]